MTNCQIWHNLDNANHVLSRLRKYTTMTLNIFRTMIHNLTNMNEQCNTQYKINHLYAHVDAYNRLIQSTKFQPSIIIKQYLSYCQTLYILYQMNVILYDACTTLHYPPKSSTPIFITHISSTCVRVRRHPTPWYSYNTITVTQYRTTPIYTYHNSKLTTSHIKSSRYDNFRKWIKFMFAELQVFMTVQQAKYIEHKNIIIEYLNVARKKLTIF